jgi:hypothetical protein
MRPRASALLAVAVAALAGACTFPDVDYADGGVSTGAGGSCPGLDACTGAAASCASTANAAWSTCTVNCHGGMGCIDKCGMTLSSELSACDTTCTGCAPPGCSGAVAACKTATGT